jgi:hypothetical protein
MSEEHLKRISDLEYRVDLLERIAREQLEVIKKLVTRMENDR